MSTRSQAEHSTAVAMLMRLQGPGDQPMVELQGDNFNAEAPSVQYGNMTPVHFPGPGPGPIQHQQGRYQTMDPIWQTEMMLNHGFGYAEQHQHQHPMMYGGQDPARNSYQGSPQFNPLMATSPSDEAAQYARLYMQQKADLLFHQQSMASMYPGCAQAHVALDIDLHSDFGVDVAYPTMSRPNPAVAPISSGSGTLATLRTQPTTVKLTGKPERLIAPTVAQLGGPMKSGPTPHTQPALSNLRPSEYDRVLDMPTTEFNHFVKVSGIVQEEAADLRKARRRKNNRVYAKRARGKKMAKLNELHATVSHLSALASVSVTVGVAGMPGGRSAMSENVADSHRVKGDGAEDAIKSSSGPVGSF